MTEPKDIRPPSDPWDSKVTLIGESPEELKAARIANYFITKMIHNNKWRNFGKGWEE